MMQYYSVEKLIHLPNSSRDTLRIRATTKKLAALDSITMKTLTLDKHTKILIKFRE